MLAFKFHVFGADKVVFLSIYFSFNQNIISFSTCDNDRLGSFWFNVMSVSCNNTQQVLKLLFKQNSVRNESINT